MCGENDKRNGAAGSRTRSGEERGRIPRRKHRAATGDLDALREAVVMAASNQDRVIKRAGWTAADLTFCKEAKRRGYGLRRERKRIGREGEE